MKFKIVVMFALCGFYGSSVKSMKRTRDEEQQREEKQLEGIKKLKLSGEQLSGLLASYYKCESGSFAFLSGLIEAGALFTNQDELGATILHCASVKGDLQLVKYLLSKGALLETQTNGGFTALHLALGKGHVEVSKLLLENGALLDARANNGFTPLHTAVYGGKQNVVELLFASNTDMHAKDHDGKTVLDIAHEKNHEDLIIYLEKCLE